MKKLINIVLIVLIGVGFVAGQYTAVKMNLSLFGKPKVVYEYKLVDSEGNIVDKDQDNGANKDKDFGEFSNENVNKTSLTGYFLEAYGSGTQSELYLNDNKTFSMTINLCEGMATIEGTFELTETKVNLSFLANQYQGFSGQEDTNYSFEIVNKNELKFLSNGKACGPFKNVVFSKQ